MNQSKQTDLNHNNYFDKKMMIKYMSNSQIKTFFDCESRALAELKEEFVVDKECFKEGHFFEACLTGNEDLFLAKNSDMVSSRGATRGELKSNYKKVEGAVEAFKKQKMFTDIIGKCEQQVIVTGFINNIEFKGCVDFLDMQTFNSYDTKCMRNFDKIWSDSEHARIEWYFAYGYHYQASIYRELIRQTFGKSGNVSLLAVSKEEIPDVKALTFSDVILDNAMEIIKEFAPRFNDLKNGIGEPTACGICDYCKQTKQVNDFEVIYDYE